MSKAVQKILLLVFVLLLSVSIAQASHHEPIVDIAAGNDNFDTLVAAVGAAGLADELSGGEWTVFGPTDAAFAKLGLNAGNIADTYTQEELAEILLYHVTDEEMSSAELKAEQGDIVMANGELAGVKYFDGDIYVNDVALVVMPNILASNGVIHGIDNVLIGPWPQDEEEPATPIEATPSGDSIAEIAMADGRFDTAVAAIVAAGLDDELLFGDDWTAFVPTDAAFASLGLNAENIADTYTQEELRDILLYHVMAEEMSTAELKADQGDFRMANNELAGVKYYDGDIYVNDDARVIDPDIVASNGVIHVVDTVILGPWPRE